jgi:hypothetical protein
MEIASSPSSLSRPIGSLASYVDSRQPSIDAKDYRCASSACDFAMNCTFPQWVRISGSRHGPSRVVKVLDLEDVAFAGDQLVENGVDEESYK